MSVIGKYLKERSIRRLIKRGLVVGKNFYAYGDVNFGSEPYLISIGDNVRVTGGVKFITHDGGVNVLRNKFSEMKNVDVLRRIVIGNNVHIGENAIIMPGVHIGDNVVIGCGSIVTRDIPSNSIAVGVPARVIETIDEYREKVIKKSLNIHNLTYEEKKEFLMSRDDL